MERAFDKVVVAFSDQGIECWPTMAYSEASAVLETSFHLKVSRSFSSDYSNED